MAKKVVIPFLPESQEAILDGRKTCTTRTKRYGRAGDWFPVSGEIFILTQIYPVSLQRVALFCYEQEGFNSTKQFVACWNTLHPRVTYESFRARPVYIHHFRPAEKAYPGMQELRELGRSEVS